MALVALARASAAVVALVGVALCGGCVDVDDDRRAFVRAAFFDDHRDLVLRDPVEVEGKFARMARDSFQFLRGNIGLWARDTITPGFAPAPCGDGLTSSVLLVGDPHVENIGTVLFADGSLGIDWNDFDASRYGPFTTDLRRLALSFAVVTADPAQKAARARAVAEGYVFAAGSDDADDDVVLGEGRDVGVVFAALLAKARKKGDEEIAPAALVRDITADTTGDDSDVPVSDDTLVSLDADDERPAVTHALAAWRADLLRDVSDDAARAARLGAVDIVDVARVKGQGVGSRPLLRYLALLDDGRVVEAKEIRDPFVIPGLALGRERVFVDNVDRVIDARRALTRDGGSDVLLGRAPLEPLALRVEHRTAYQRSLRVADLGAFAEDDVVDAARLAGRLLADAHGRAPGPDGVARGAALRALLERCGDAVVDDTAAFVVAYDDVHAHDLAIFRALLDEDGPLLGFDRVLSGETP